MKAAAEVFGSGSAPSQGDCHHQCHRHHHHHHHYCLYHHHLYDDDHQQDNFIPSLGLDSEEALAPHVEAPRASARPDNMLMIMMMIMMMTPVMMMISSNARLTDDF